jgi:hypothetical protein
LEYIYSLRANPLARSPGQVKLDSDKWKLWKNCYLTDIFYLWIIFLENKCPHYLDACVNTQNINRGKILFFFFFFKLHKIHIYQFLEFWNAATIIFIVVFLVVLVALGHFFFCFGQV